MPAEGGTRTLCPKFVAFSRLVIYCASRVAIGAHVKEILAGGLEHVGDLVQYFRDFIVLHSSA